MSVAILERKVNTESEKELNASLMSAEEKHNSRISANYAKLINPENTIRDILAWGESVRLEEKNVIVADREAGFKKVAKASEAVPYRVENARADAAIFRADSLVNRQVGAVAAVETAADEDENEDLRPTQTTIQYKTVGVKKAEEGKIETKAVAKKSLQLTKRDKITVAVAFAVIVALFVLIIVNSAIIAGLNSEVSALQTALNNAESTYAEVLSQKNAYMNEANLFNIVSNFAAGKGMILK